MTKAKLFRHVSVLITEKISHLQQDISDLQKDIAEDSKSSAGDKFETSREMAQQELQKISSQLAGQLRLKNLIESQDTETPSIIKVGTLAITSSGVFLVGIPIGKVLFENTPVTGIGVSAPLGQLLLNKSENDQFSFNGQSFRIEKIY
ncbi:hypothetical protein [Fluviicola sp.]|jgi:hypothetical protein|uniref:hypothetical protein n=1 Tax=Fluviicola sp. TaxID=1917219 RepID=UPI0028360317|nr:hypothetical protein [Fluviicola sp.]MDR0802712.1 hypothetical protein [Fluviicola sp.]